MYRLLACVSILALALLALGCGGSDGDGETAEATLTKPQFIKQAEGACAEIAKKREAAAAAWQKENPGAAGQNQLDDAFREVVAPAIQEQVEALEALPAPVEDEAKIDRMIANLRKTAEKISSEGTGGTGAPELFEFQQQAGSYGLEGCAQLF